MLILKRPKGSSTIITIKKGLKIEIINLGNDEFAFKAPKSILIERKEIYKKRKQKVIDK